MSILSYVCALLLSSATGPSRWHRLPDLVPPEGLAGCFAGQSGGYLLAAGGSNFPDKRPWDGGKKVWYDDIYARKPGQLAWVQVGKLPTRLAYGVFCTYKDSLICAGGSDETTHHTASFALRLVGGKVQIDRLPSLPEPIANGCGCLVGNRLFVLGGQTTAKSMASNKLFSLNLAHPQSGWKVRTPLPGPSRILAGCGSMDGSFYVMGGAALLATKGAPIRRYLRDAYRFSPSKGWQRLADMPVSLVATPAPIPTDGHDFILLGGDDGSQVGVRPTQHKGFFKFKLRYQPARNRWFLGDKLPVKRATAPVVQFQNRWILIGGEQRPGVRSPEVWSMPLSTADH